MDPSALIWIIIILLLSQREGPSLRLPRDWDLGFVVFLLFPSLICFSLFFVWCLNL